MQSSHPEVTTIDYSSLCRLSDSGEDAKEKGTQKVGGAGKRKKEGIYFGKGGKVENCDTSPLSESLEQATIIGPIFFNYLTTF